MRKFTAGRFEAQAFVGPENGRSTWLIELHRNGSGDRVGILHVDYEDLRDIKHVLDRAIAAHGAASPMENWMSFLDSLPDGVDEMRAKYGREKK